MKLTLTTFTDSISEVFDNNWLSESKSLFLNNPTYNEERKCIEVNVIHYSNKTGRKEILKTVTLDFLDFLSGDAIELDEFEKNKREELVPISWRDEEGLLHEETEWQLTQIWQDITYPQLTIGKFAKAFEELLQDGVNICTTLSEKESLVNHIINVISGFQDEIGKSAEGDLPEVHSEIVKRCKQIAYSSSEQISSVLTMVNEGNLKLKVNLNKADLCKLLFLLEGSQIIDAALRRETVIFFERHLLVKNGKKFVPATIAKSLEKFIPKREGIDRWVQENKIELPKHF